SLDDAGVLHKDPALRQAAGQAFYRHLEVHAARSPRTRQSATAPGRLRGLRCSRRANRALGGGRDLPRRRATRTPTSREPVSRLARPAVPLTQRPATPRAPAEAE